MVGTGATHGRAGLVAVALLAVLATAACGEQQAGGPTVSSSPTGGSADAVTPTPSADATGQDALTVSLDDGNGSTSTWTLTCAADGTPGGDHPDAAAACAALAAAAQPFAPVRKDMACTMVYGGPQKATVQGTWGGQDVSASFDRTDGCQIARWDRIAPVLQPGTTAGRAAGAL